MVWATYRAFSLKQLVHVVTTVLKYLENSQYLSVRILDTWDCNYLIIIIMNQSFYIFVSFSSFSLPSAVFSSSIFFSFDRQRLTPFVTSEQEQGSVLR